VSDPTNPLTRPPVAIEPADGESLPSQTMQAEDERLGFQPPSNTTLPTPQEERESQTARTLAITLVIMLGITFLAQYISLWVLTVYNHVDAIPHFEHLFNVWLPVLASLVGTAVGFYLKERKG
jgi:hypothetical protein